LPKVIFGGTFLMVGTSSLMMRSWFLWGPSPTFADSSNDGHLGRNYLKGTLGDKINAILSGIGHNFRLLLRWIRDLFAFILALLFGRNFSLISQPAWTLNLKGAF
jgi:hypothetical protein